MLKAGALLRVFSVHGISAIFLKSHVHVGQSVRPPVSPSHFAFLNNLKVEKTDGLTGMVTNRVACTQLMAIGLVLE